MLAVATHHTWYKFRSELHDAELARQLPEELQLPGETILVVLNQQTAGIGKRVRQVPGAEVYRR